MNVFRCYYILILLLILQLTDICVYILFNNYKYISKINTLCYSFVPYNKLIIGNGLCNINCSYTRLKHFPLNSALKCKKVYTTKRNNSYSIYYFNTTTYGSYVKEYRYFYGYGTVYFYL